MENINHLNRGANAPQQEHPSSPNLRRIALWVGLIITALAVLGAGYIWFAGGSGAPSATISAPSLELKPGDTRQLFSISAEESQARFIIQETLLGNPKTVIGVTNQVAGQMLIDFETPVESVLGVIRINVRTLETDNEFRNRALRGQILQADRPEYEFAEFTPTALENLPETITTGEAFTFQIVGSLKLHGVSRDVTFEATVTPVSDSQIQGIARASILYADFGMSIPEAAGVAHISDTVQIEIDMTASIISRK